MKYISLMDCKTTYNEAFRKYGRVLEENFPDIEKYLEDKTSIPEEGNIYIASDPKFEKLKSYDRIKKIYYGNLDIEFGYCNGNNKRLNALEYHMGSEINVACTDFVLLLGDIRDIENDSYDTNKVEAFLIKKGQAIEIYSTTLHFSPIEINNNGFKCAVVLPRFTNTEIDYEGEGLLFKNNKWILTHKEHKKLVEAGVKGRLVGENIELI